MTSELPSEEHIGSLEPVAYFNEAMPTGVTVSLQGRIFVNFPKWGDDVPFTVAEIRDGKTMAYPNKALNQTNENDLAAAFVSVQSVVVDPADRLRILDTGSPLFRPTQFGNLVPNMISIYDSKQIGNMNKYIVDGIVQKPYFKRILETIFCG
jgi:hypothetical protein